VHLPRISTKLAGASHCVNNEKLIELRDPEILFSEARHMDRIMGEAMYVSPIPQIEARVYRVFEQVIGIHLFTSCREGWSLPTKLHNSDLYDNFRIDRLRMSYRITCPLFLHLSIFACSQLPFLHFFIGTSDQLFLSIILAANDLHTIIYPPKSTSPNVSLRLSPNTLFLCIQCNKL
jgi:hypothetical protein